MPLGMPAMCLQAYFVVYLQAKWSTCLQACLKQAQRYISSLSLWAKYNSYLQAYVIQAWYFMHMYVPEGMVSFTPVGTKKSVPPASAIPFQEGDSHSVASSWLLFNPYGHPSVRQMV